MAGNPPYLRVWTPHRDEADHVRSAAAVARFALMSVDLTDKHRVRLLNDAVWYRTEAAGKISLRFRSAGVLALAARGPKDWRSQVRHDHVQTRASLIKHMTERPDAVEEILRDAVACLVTVTEHDNLGAFDASAVGWARYLRARVDVYDFSADPPEPFIADGVRLARPNPGGGVR